MHLTATSQCSPRIRPRLNDLDGREWVQATKTVLFQHGLGYSHPETRIERQHPAPFSYRDAERLIRLFSRTGEEVLDPFSGVGSTLKACALSGRKGTGIELSKTFCRLTRARMKEEVEEPRARADQTVLCGDSRALVAKLADNRYSFILSSPPYWSILARAGQSQSTRYRKGSSPYGNDKRDFGTIEDYDEFVEELAIFVDSLKRVLQPKGYMAIMVADFRFGDTLYALQADLIAALRQLNRTGSRRLVLQGIKIIAQNHKKLYPYGFPTTYVPNIHHQYVLIFRNVVESDAPIRPKSPSPGARGKRTAAHKRNAAHSTRAKPFRSKAKRVKPRRSMPKRAKPSRSAAKRSSAKSGSKRRGHADKAKDLRRKR
jgi:DNA modification methylase